jgi:hypothetical protein
MKRRRHTPEQVIRKLAEGEKLLAQGQSIEEVVRYLEITESTGADTVPLQTSPLPEFHS